MNPPTHRAFSRETPPLPDRTSAEWSIAGIVLLASLCAALGYSLITEPLPMAIIAVTLALWLYWANHSYDKHLESVRRSRPGQSICDFARDFDRGCLDAWVVRAVWDALQAYVGKKDNPFPVRAEDTLADTLWIAEEDIDELIDDVAQRAGRSLERTEGNPYYGEVHTVGDVVRLLQAQPLA